MMYTRLVLSDKSPWWSSKLVFPVCPYDQRAIKREDGRITKRTFMLIIKKMIDARGIETRGATNDAVHLVALLE